MDSKTMCFWYVNFLQLTNIREEPDIPISGSVDENELRDVYGGPMPKILKTGHYEDLFT